MLANGPSVVLQYIFRCAAKQNHYKAATALVNNRATALKTDDTFVLGRSSLILFIGYE